MMKRVIVLGAGLVGKPMMLDILNDQQFEVGIADNNKNLLAELQNTYKVKTFLADLSNKDELQNLIRDFDYVINAVPGFMGYKTLEYILEAGKDVVDIAFSPEDLSPLDELAKKNNVTAIVDFGVAPGLSHMMVAHAQQMFDSLEKVRIFVGGLPKHRSKPFEYKAVFSPIDVIEEYTRPARLVEHGHMVIKEALTDIEEIEFEGLGTLEAFNSDGLRSLVDSIPAIDMAEKTLRYPGHAVLMKLLRDIGFFDQNPLDIGGSQVSPLEMTAKLIFPQWEMKEMDRDITVMWIYAEGPVNGKKHRFEFRLYDEFNEKTGVHSMARTTGYTATMGFRALANDLIKEKGVFYPEKVGNRKEVLDFILKGLADREIQIETKFYSI